MSMTRSLLFHNDLGGSLGVDTEAAVGQPNDCRHGLSVRVEGVDLEEGLLRVLFPDLLVAEPDVHHVAEEGALGLVAHLLRRLSLL